MTIDELDKYIYKHIQGVFYPNDMRILKEEIEKLKSGDLYVEIGVDEGRSARIAHEYADQGVIKIYIDINNVDHFEWDGGSSIGRGRWMQQEKMVGIGINGFFIHGDADLFPQLIKPVNLIHIDGHHNYDSVKQNTLIWEPRMAKNGVMLFHDYDHPETKQWLDEHYGDNKEILHGKVVRVRL